MANTTTATCLPLFPSLEMAWRDVDSSFERFCLTAGIGAVASKCCARTRSSLPARRTVAAGSGPTARSELICRAICCARMVDWTLHNQQWRIK